MKDWGFIERLSQYLDGELPSAEVARLEQELRSEPAKMQMYRQYLRINRGAEALCRAIEAEAIRPKVDLERNVIWVPKTVARRRSSRSFLPSWSWAMAGTAAAAACAVVVVRTWSGQPVVDGAVVQFEPPAEGTRVAARDPLYAALNRHRETPRLESWSKMVPIEVRGEIPEMPALPVTASVHSNMRGIEAGSGLGGGRFIHGGSGTYSPASVSASFASYEFRR